LSNDSHSKNNSALKLTGWEQKRVSGVDRFWATSSQPYQRCLPAPTRPYPKELFHACDSSKCCRKSSTPSVLTPQPGAKHMHFELVLRATPLGVKNFSVLATKAGRSLKHSTPQMATLTFLRWSRHACRRARTTARADTNLAHWSAGISLISPWRNKCRRSSLNTLVVTECDDNRRSAHRISFTLKPAPQRKRSMSSRGTASAMLGEASRKLPQVRGRPLRNKCR